jgi:hypothetical protein
MQGNHILLAHSQGQNPLWVVRTMKISDFFAEPMKISVKHTDLGANSYQ